MSRARIAALSGARIAALSGARIAALSGAGIVALSCARIVDSASHFRLRAYRVSAAGLPPKPESLAARY